MGSAFYKYKSLYLILMHLKKNKGIEFNLKASIIKININLKALIIMKNISIHQ